MPTSIAITFQDYFAPQTYATQVWKMASVPVSPTNGSPSEILVALGNYGTKRWRLFRFFDGGYHEFLRENIGGFEPGRAFWLHIREAGLKLRSGGGQTSPMAEPFEIDLAPGWNDIGTPFAFAVRWDDIMAASGDPAGVAGPFAFDGTSWSFPDPSDRLAPWEGYAVKNNNSADVILRVPGLSNGSGKDIAKAASESDGWALQVKAVAGGARDVNNYLGFRPGAEEEWDPADLPEPPAAPGEHVSLYFPHRDWEEYPDVYTSDFRPEADGYSWDFEVRASLRNARIDLSIDGLDEMPAGTAVQLLDLDRGLKLRVEEGASFPLSLPDANARRRFKIVVGSEDYVSAASEGFLTVPDGYALPQSWPNPFNAGVTIPYELPEQTEIRLAIYDALGQVVNVLEDGMRDPGYHRVHWDGRDASGRRAASGVYFYMLRTERGRLVKKMVMVE